MELLGGALVGGLLHFGLRARGLNLYRASAGLLNLAVVIYGHVPATSSEVVPLRTWPLLRTRTIEGFPEKNPSRQTDYQTYCVPAAYLTAAYGQRIEKRVEYN